MAILFCIFAGRLEGRINKIMNITINKTNKKDFLKTYAEVLNSLTEEKNRLNNSELKFFTDLCYLYNEGIDLTDFDLMSDKIIEMGTFNNKKTISQYKTRLGAKRWIRTGFGILEIPTTFELDKIGNNINITINYHEKEEADIGASN